MLIKDKLALRVSGAFTQRDGWMQEENPNLASQNGTGFWGGRVSLLYRPTEKLEVTLKGNYSRDDKAEFKTDYIVSSFGHRLDVDEIYHNPLDRRSFRNDDNVYFNRSAAGGRAAVLPPHHATTPLHPRAARRHTALSLALGSCPFRSGRHRRRRSRPWNLDQS